MVRDNEERITVGIFMPAFNQGQFIDDAIDSLKKQTFQDFVVHIVDDGSNDGVTPEKLKSIKYEKAKLFLNKDNKGVVYRAMQHYKKFHTKYVLVLCGDDMLAPEFLEKTVAFLEEHQDYGAVSTDIAEYLDSFDGEPFAEFHYDEKKMGLPAMLSECHCLGSYLMRNEALMAIDLSGGFTRYQDWDRWISMLEAGWKLGVVSEPLFKYRIHQKSLSHSVTAEKETEVFEKIVKKHNKLYKKYMDNVMPALFHRFYEVVLQNNELSKNNVDLNNRVQVLSEEIDCLKKKKFGFLKKIVRKLKL